MKGEYNQMASLTLFTMYALICASGKIFQGTNPSSVDDKATMLKFG